MASGAAKAAPPCVSSSRSTPVSSLRPHCMSFSWTARSSVPSSTRPSKTCALMPTSQTQPSHDAGRFRTSPQSAAKLTAVHHRPAEFFLPFPCKCRLRGFALSDLAPRKFPLARRAVVWPPLPDQQSPVAALNPRRHHDDHLSGFLCVSALFVLR